MKFIVINFNSRNVKIPVLMYHGLTLSIPLTDPYDFQYITTQERFEENVKALLNDGFKTISFMKLYNAKIKNKGLPKKPIIITFDDGLESQYTLAYPIIKKYNIKAVIFVTTDLVGKEVNGIKYFDWNQAREMQNSGLVEICSHGKRHIAYDTVPINEFKDDILMSFEVLNNNLDYDYLKVFAYPFGIHNQAMVDVLKLNGIQIQANGLGMNSLNTLDLSLVNRINVPYYFTGDQIIKGI